MLEYYITDRQTCRVDLLDCIEANARRGVDWIQIREKDLPVRDLLALASAAASRIRPLGTRLLVNGRMDVALAAGAHGVHLPGDAPSVASLRRAAPAGFLFGVSTHDIDGVVRAEREGADLAVFGPVFPTSSKPGLDRFPGLDGLRAACSAVRIPVAALGGLNRERVPDCLAAGAAGVAGISMFQQAAKPAP